MTPNSPEDWLKEEVPEIGGYMKNSHLKDWIARVYNKHNECIGKWKIENRTENEAENEAIADLKDFPDYSDWTLTPI